MFSKTVTETEGSHQASWPAEWSPHAACILLYPHNPGTFRLDRARPEFLAVARAIAHRGGEAVLLFCKDDTQATSVEKCLVGAEKEQIKVFTCPSNDSWARDTAPTFVIVSRGTETTTTTATSTRSTLLGLDWAFNAYGGPEEGCYWPCTLDQQIAKSMCHTINEKRPLKSLTVKHQTISLVLEGGSIHTDGEGTVLTTKECLLHPSRNPNKSQSEIEAAILEVTGCRKMIWLEHGLAFDDDTNGHVDNFACFVSPTAIVLAWTDDQDGDPINYQRCRAAMVHLQATTDAKGRYLTIHKLQLPRPMFYSQEEIDSLRFGKYEDTTVYPREVGERMAASYVNFYIANEAVIVPQFGDAEFDAPAVHKLQELFPNRKAVGVPSREILIGGGNIHCITQQIPKM